MLKVLNCKFPFQLNSLRKSSHILVHTIFCLNWTACLNIPYNMFSCAFHHFQQGFLGNLVIHFFATSIGITGPTTRHAQIMHSYFIHLLLRHETCFHKHMVILFQTEKCKVTKQFNLVNSF